MLVHMNRFAVWLRRDTGALPRWPERVDHGSLQQ
jgi:hypothetical protein